jgi:hypothetical protein
MTGGRVQFPDKAITPAASTATPREFRRAVLGPHGLPYPGTAPMHAFAASAAVSPRPLVSLDHST